ncbi:MAG: hypothetical protein AAFR38_07510 [Planctomycetota bacterium]
MNPIRRFSISTLAAIATALTAAPAAAQFGESPIAIQQKRETLAALMRPVSLDVQDTRLGDIVEFIETTTGTDLEPLWLADNQGTGLDPEMTISVRARNQTALALIEAVLERVDRTNGQPDASTWQFTRTGAFEFGPKELLNRRQVLHIYDVQDLLFEVPDYTNAPEFDLNSVFSQGGQGGGGGQSPFQQNQTDQPILDKEALLEELQILITTLVEPDQWADFGGDGGTIRVFRGSMIIRAADYLHRGIDGYRWWPAQFQHARRGTQGQRYITMGASTSLADVVFEGEVEVTGAVGGGNP